MKTGKELKPGTVIRLENDPWLVQKAEFTKSGRNSAIMKTKRSAAMRPEVMKCFLL